LLERDHDLAYLLITLKIPICVSGLFEREGTVHMGFERIVREVLIHIPLHVFESFRRYKEPPPDRDLSGQH
jgi:hypothetical protein